MLCHSGGCGTPKSMTLVYYAKFYDRSGRDQAPTCGETRTANIVYEQIIIHVPNGGLIGARIVKQIVGPAVSIKIGQAHHVISWHNCRSGSAASVRGSQQIPNHGCTRAGIHQQIIGMTITVKIGNPSQSPAGRNGGPKPPPICTLFRIYQTTV